LRQEFTATLEYRQLMIDNHSQSLQGPVDARYSIDGQIGVGVGVSGGTDVIGIKELHLAIDEQKVSAAFSENCPSGYCRITIYDGFGSIRNLLGKNWRIRKDFILTYR
jgi:hypothetical protein